MRSSGSVHGGADRAQPQHHRRANQLFKDYAGDHFITFYGEPFPPLIDLLRAHHMERQFKWFSFVGGVDSSTR